MSDRETLHLVLDVLEAKERDRAVVVNWAHKGEYEARQFYGRGDVVRLNGATYVSVSDTPGPCPDDGWQLVASVGARGEKGDRGDPGRVGKAGQPGPPGAVGAPGRSIRWRGRYAPFTEYNTDDVVHYDNALWIALQPTEAGPKADQVNWDLMIRLRGGGVGGGTSVECPMYMVAPYTPHMNVTCGAVAQDEGWLMHANKTTSDRAAPRFVTDEAWAVFGDATPTWADMTTGTTRLVTGLRIKAENYAQVRAIRVWIPFIDPDIRYSVLIFADVTSSSVPHYVDISPVETGWHVLYDNAISGLAGGGEIDVDVYLVAQGQGSSATTFTHNWNRRAPAASPNPDVPPLPGQFVHYVSAAPHIAYVNKTDDDGVSRKNDLDTLQAGDTIAWTDSDGVDVFFTLTADPTYYNSAVGEEDFYELNLSPAEGQGSNGSVAMTFTHFLDRPMDYVRIADQFAGSAVLRGLYAEGGASEVTETDDAYGVDVLYREVEASPDWDFMSYSG